MSTDFKIAKEASISFAGMSFGQVVRYLFTTLLARWAGVELLGVYSLANAVSRIFEVIGKLGLDQGLIRKLNQTDSNNKKQLLIRSALKMGFIFGLIIMLFQIIISKWLAVTYFNQSNFLHKVIIFHAISIPLFVLIQISTSVTQAYKVLKYKIIVTELINPFILFSVMVICYLLNQFEVMIILPVLCAGIIGLIFSSIFLKKISNVHIFSTYQGKLNKELINLSLPIMFISILGTILHWTDVIMLGYFTDNTTVGIYHPPARTAGIIRMILVAFAGIYGPIMAELYYNQKLNQMKYLFRLVTRWIITFSLPILILFLLFPKKIMLVFGSEFIDGHSILSILVIAAFIQVSFGIGGVTLNMTAYPKINLINTLIGCGINILFNIVLIPKLAAIGAAISTLVTLLVIALLRGLQNWKLLNLYHFDIKITKPLIAGSIATFFGYLIKEYIIAYHTVVTLFYAAFIIFFIFFIVLWLLGFDRDDIEIINRLNFIKTKIRNSSNENIL